MFCVDTEPKEENDNTACDHLDKEFDLRSSTIHHNLEYESILRERRGYIE